MDLQEEIEVDENEQSHFAYPNQSSLTFLGKNCKRKASFLNRRRGSSVLTELETISENNAFSDYKAQGNLSLNLHNPARQKSDRLCQSFTHSSTLYSSNDSSYITDTLHQLPSPSNLLNPLTTPPSVLRQRVKEANEVKNYLEQELKELKEFTTIEKQILAVEKGYETLQEENVSLKMELNCLQEQNLSMKKELEEMNKLADSQKELISDLKSNFDESKTELKYLQKEKVELEKELDKVKKRLLDEEVKLELAASKWKTREDELKKSLEDSWAILKFKEDRLTKMKENINFLYSERDIIRQCGQGESVVPYMVTLGEKIKVFDSKVNELFSLTFSENETDYLDVTCLKDSDSYSREDSNEYKQTFEIEVLRSDLRKYQKDVAVLNKKLEEQDSALKKYTSAFCSLEQSLKYHGECSSDHESCKEQHESVIDKITCELLRYKNTSLEVLKNSAESNSEIPVFGINDTPPEELKIYENKMKMLEAEISEYKNRLFQEESKITILRDISEDALLLSESGQKICHSSEEINNIQSTSRAEIACLTSLENEVTNEFCSRTPLVNKNDNGMDKCFQLSYYTDDAYCQTDFDFAAENDYVVRIKELENIISANSVISNTNINCKENECFSTNRADVCSQTQYDMLSIQEYEDKINYLENITKENKKLYYTTCNDRSIQQSHVSSQTPLYFMSVNEYEDEQRNLNILAAENNNLQVLDSLNEIMQLSIEHDPSKAEIDLLKQNKNEISNLEMIIAESSASVSTGTPNKSQTVSTASSQTEINAMSVKQYDNKINLLETLNKESNKLQAEDSVNKSIQFSTDQEHVSSQTELDIMSVKQYEDKIRNLETLIAEISNTQVKESANKSVQNCIQNDHVSSQTELDVMSLKQYEAKISDLEKLIADNINYSEHVCVASQTDFGLNSVKEYIDEVSSLEVLLSVDSFEINCQRPLEQADFSCKTPETLLEAKERKKSNNSIIDIDTSLSDMSNESALKRILNKSDFHNSGIGMNSVLGEFIDCPIPDTSTLDFTFNGQLEHSILKSKLKSVDLLGSECSDPLAGCSDESISPCTIVPLHSQSTSDVQLKLLKEQYKNLTEELELCLAKNNKSMLLINEIEKLILFEYISEDDIISKLKTIVQVIKDLTVMPKFKDIKTLGLLTFLKNVCIENDKLSDKNLALNLKLEKVNERLFELKSIKCDFLQLRTSAQSLKNVDMNFQNLNRQLKVLYENIGANNVTTNELNENLKNCIHENAILKEELSKLVVCNKELQATSDLYDTLVHKYSELQDILDKKENEIKENKMLKTCVHSFMEKISSLNVLSLYGLQCEHTSDEHFYESCLLIVEKILTDCQHIFNLLLNSSKISGHDLFKSIDNICQKQEFLTKSNESLKSNSLLVQNKLLSLTNNFRQIQNNFKYLSSDALKVKESVNQELLLIKQEVGHLIENLEIHLEQLNSENVHLKSQIINLESLLTVNDKYSELLNKYNALETDFLQCKSNCSEYLKLNQSMKSNIMEIENCNKVLNDKVCLYESEIHAYKDKNDVLQEKIRGLEPLTLISEKYSLLVKSFEDLQKEILVKEEEKRNIIQQYESLKINMSEIEMENIILKNRINEFEEDALAYQDKLQSLEKIKYEHENLVIKLENLEKVNDNYLSLLTQFKELECDFLPAKEMCPTFESALISIRKVVSNLQSNNSNLEETITKYINEISDYQRKLNTLEKTEAENNDLKEQIGKLQSLISVNDKYSELLSMHQNLEAELSRCSQNYTELLDLYEKLNVQNKELEEENENYKLEICKYESDITETKKSIEAAELKFAEMEREINENNAQKWESKLNELNAFTNSLKEEKNKYVTMIEQLMLLIKSVDLPEEEFDRIIMEESRQDFKDIFLAFKNLFFEHSTLKIRLNVLENSMAHVNEEKIDLNKKIESLNKEIALSQQEQQLLEIKLSSLLSKEEEHSELLKVETQKFNKEISDILSSLNYPEEPVINNESLLFIKDSILSYKSKLGSNNYIDETNGCDFERKIAFLESQLLDTDNFKRKFSKELHGLKPDLNISDLMKLSLEDLQITMLSTIMEKESAVVANLEKDYEMKLALSSERIHQLEEEEKRRATWIKEIECENDRVLNECKQIQKDNENLRHDILLKVEKIESLEKQIEERRAKLTESLMFDEENEKHKLEEIEKEKVFYESSVHAVNDLSNKLDNKNKECEEALATLQCKSETIFQLEKLICDARVEKAHLEEEVKMLKESLTSQLNIFEEYKNKMENEISQYKVELDKVNNDLTVNKENHLKEKLDLQSEIASKVFLIEQIEKLGKEADIVIKHNIGRMLDSHVEKVDKLNTKIKQLSSQLVSQNSRLSQFKNQHNNINNLKSEIDDLKATVAILNKEKNDMMSLKNDYFFCTKEESSLVEDNNNIKLELEKVRNELSTVQEERNAFLQDSLDCHLMREKLLSLNDSLQELKRENDIIKNKNIDLEKIASELEKVRCEYQSLLEVHNHCKQDLRSLQNEVGLIQRNSIEHELTKKTENANQIKYQEELEFLKTENESLISSNSSLIQELNDEISLLKDKLNSTQAELTRLANEKESLKKEFFENLKFEKDLRNSVKVELAKKENEVLNLKKDKDILLLENQKSKQMEQTEINNLTTMLQKAQHENKELQNELVSLKQILDEKTNSLMKLQSQIDEFSLKYHSDECCPHKRELTECKVQISEFEKMLSHERETFKLWKTNFEEDVRCKVLLIGDLESKLKKEAQNYKEAMMSVADMQHKLLEQEEKLRKTEEKINMQREVFIREKSKLESEVKNKEKFELRVGDLKKKSEELAHSINIFLEKLGSILKKEIPNLGSAFHEVKLIYESLEEEKEKVKQLDEECEELNGNIKYLENELGKLYISEEAENKKFNEELAKLKEEQDKNAKLTIKLVEARNQVSSLQNDFENLEKQIELFKHEKDSYEIKIKNLLEEKLELKCQINDLEQKITELATTNEIVQKKGNNQLEDLKKELKYLQLLMVNKNTKISNLESRLESDCLPFQRRAEAAEKKVEELSKELKSMKVTLNSRDSAAVNSSLRVNPVVELSPSRIDTEKSQLITSLQEENKKLQKEKRSLKQLALLRHKEIKDLTAKLQRLEMRVKGQDQET